jgi:hypothetical protein
VGQFIRTGRVRQLTVIVAFAALSIATVKLVNDPFERFHRLTGLRRPMEARVLDARPPTRSSRASRSRTRNLRRCISPSGILPSTTIMAVSS